MKKVICLILSFIMVFSFVPLNVLAVEDTDDTLQYEESEEDSGMLEAMQLESEDDEIDETALSDDRTETIKEGEEETPSVIQEEENSEEAQKAEENADEIQFLDEDQGETDEAEWKELPSLSLKYDDRYTLQDLLETSGITEEYKISEIINTPTSYQVDNGKKTESLDESVITQETEDSLKLAAIGVGTAVIYLLPANQEETDESAEDTGQTGEPEPVENGLKVEVTVDPATLTLMYLTGQSNMEGQCSSSTGYRLYESIACEEGTVYSTYAPTNSNSNTIAGLTFSSYCDVDNANDFVAGSLQSNTSISGENLQYTLDSLTTVGNGKAGPDSGLAYEWNQLTEDKVWVINTAWSGTNIASWQPGTGSLYKRSEAVWDCVDQVYQAEIDAGHYTKGSRLAFWLQGETGDKTKAAADYKSDFSNMYTAMKSELGLDAMGIIMVRASTGSYMTDDEWEMTGPRIAQYVMGGSSGLSGVYVASNANEQWVSDSGVNSYFSEAYPSGTLDYPMHDGASSSLPTTVNQVHSDIHYSQIGHNENGITAAYGIYQALRGSSVPTDVEWRDEDGKTVTSLNMDSISDDAILVPVTDPIYAAKRVSYSVSGDAVSFDSSTDSITAKATGTSVISASYNGNTLSQISVTVGEGVEKIGNEWLYVKNGEVDYSYTGFAKNQNGWWYIENGKVTFNKNSVIQDTNKKIDGTKSWWYVVGSKVQLDFTGLADYSNSNGWWYINDGKVTFDVETVAQNKNGWYYVEDSKVDFNYNGFAHNSNGWWYIESGKVTFNKNSVIQDTKKKINGKSDWWYVVGSQVKTSFTGLADYSNSNGWWYINDGKVTFDVETVAQNKNGWYYVKDSKVDFNYNGFAHNSNGWWYMENGKVTFNKNSVIQDTNKKIDGTKSWWYVVDSNVKKSFTGLADYPNSNGWWYINNGKVTFDVNTVAKNKNGWWYVLDSKVQFGFTGLADYSNSNGWWYINDGKVTFNVNTVAQNRNGWWYIKDSKVDFGFNGIASNKNGSWYIQGGKVIFSYNGTYRYNGKTYKIVNGKVQN